MDKPNIVLIGAGSAQFSLITIYDIIRHSSLHRSKLTLVDIDEERLKLAERLARRLNEEFKAGLKIESTLDRKVALDGADFIISAVEVERERCWKFDCEIPLKYEVKQVVGECGGPGGLFHALRIIPIVLDMQRRSRYLP